MRHVLLTLALVWILAPAIPAVSESDDRCSGEGAAIDLTSETHLHPVCDPNG